MKLIGSSGDILCEFVCGSGVSGLVGIRPNEPQDGHQNDEQLVFNVIRSAMLGIGESRNDLHNLGVCFHHIAFHSHVSVADLGLKTMCPLQVEEWCGWLRRIKIDRVAVEKQALQHIALSVRPQVPSQPNSTNNIAVVAEVGSSLYG